MPLCGLPSTCTPTPTPTPTPKSRQPACPRRTWTSTSTPHLLAPHHAPRTHPLTAAPPPPPPPIPPARVPSEDLDLDQYDARLAARLGDEGSRRGAPAGGGAFAMLDTVPEAEG
jgi:hypothetical protein